jgi:hypothetical protein
MTRAAKTCEAFFLSTDEDELNYFTGETVGVAEIVNESCLPSGTYRVVDGELYRIQYGQQHEFKAKESGDE